MKVMALRQEAVLTNPGSYCQPSLAVDRDLFEIGSADGPVSDRDLVHTAGTVVANAQGILAGINRGRSPSCAQNSRAVWG